MVSVGQWKAWAYVGIVTLVLLGMGLFFGGGEPTEAATIGTNVESFKQLSDRFVSLAEEKGALYAYAILREAALPPQTDLHLLAHTVGDELYKQKGVAGIEHCTQEFRNACSHAIVIGALNEFGGDSALQLIRDACKRAPGGLGAYTMCFHGLGHGVFAYYAYDLKKTVDFCRKTGTEEYSDEEFTQCVGGAIMELMGGGGHDHELWLVARKKYLDPSDPLTPCTLDEVPEQAKSFCYTYLTPRLLEYAGANIALPEPKFFPKAFGYCDAIPKSSQRLRDACFGGFGKEFVPLMGARDVRAVDRYTDEQFRGAGEWCALSVQEDGQRACIGEAVASVFWGGENDESASLRFCSLAPLSLQEACYKRIAKDASRYLRGERLTAFCNQLPLSHQSACRIEKL